MAGISPSTMVRSAALWSRIRRERGVLPCPAEQSRGRRRRMRRMTATAAPNAAYRTGCIVGDRGEAAERLERRPQDLDEGEIDDQAGDDGRRDHRRGLERAPMLVLSIHVDLLAAAAAGRPLAPQLYEITGPQAIAECGPSGRGSIDVEQEALQVGGLGMVDVDRVVEGLAVLLDDADPPPRFVGRLEDDLLEEGLVDEMGAGEGQDEAGRRGRAGRPGG